jgi:hypothetical protein
MRGIPNGGTHLTGGTVGHFGISHLEILGGVPAWVIDPGHKLV